MSESIYRVTLDLKANGESAVRAVRQVATESQKSGDKVVESNTKQEHSFEEVGKSAHRFRDSISSLAGTIGLAGLGFGIADVIKAGQDWQLQQSRLQQALRTTGQLSKATMDQLNRSAESTAVHGGFAAPEQIGALAQFVRLTGSATRAIQVNKAAMQLARGTGLDYSRTQTMLGQALTGNVGRLQKYLGIIMPVKTAEFALSQAHQTNIFQLEMQAKALGKLGPLWLKQQEIAHNLTPQMIQHAQLLDRQATAMKVVQIIQDKYNGSMQTFSHTTAGAISNAKNAIDLAIEKLGAAALPIVARIATAIAGLVTFLSTHKSVLVGFGIALAAIGTAFAFVKIVNGIRAMADALKIASGALRTFIGLEAAQTSAATAAAAATAGEDGAITAGAGAAGGLGKFGAAMGALGPLATVGAIGYGLAASGSGNPLAFKKGEHAVGMTVAHNARGGGFAGGGRMSGLSGFGYSGPIHKESVQNVGVSNMNSINARGNMPLHTRGHDEVYVSAPIRIQAGGRVLAETTVHFAAKKASLAGAYVSG